MMLNNNLNNCAFSACGPNILLSPKSSSSISSPSASSLSFQPSTGKQNPSSNSATFSSHQITSSKSATATAATPNHLTSNQLYSGGIDEKSLKDIVDILSKRIDLSKNLVEFSQILQIDNINAPTISGHTEFYYPNLTYQISNYHQDLPEISKIKSIPIPYELCEQFQQMQQTYFMGLFTQISRAWLSIDNLLFFWNYEDGTDLCFYDSLNEPILSVELFRPRAQTFDDQVEYALCIATMSQVVLVSIDFIRFTKGNGAIVNEMRFSPQPIYSISTDSVIMNCLKASTQTGRIFMGGKDGSLYEFQYQNQSSWFSSQSKKINLSHSKFHYLVPSIFNFNDADSIVQIELDESRQILYTRSENSTIQVFYLGQNGLEISKISYLTCNTIASKAATLINSNDKHLFMPIIHISSIKQSDSRNISLVAITQFGLRLYFSVHPFEQFQQQQQQQYQQHTTVPSLLQLVHVRLPPQIISNRQISTAYHSTGISLMFSKQDEQSDSVLLLNRDLFLLHSQYKESKQIFNLSGRIWDCQEIQPNLNLIRNSEQTIETITSASNSYVAKLSSEYFDLPRRFVMLTPQGCFIWNKLRPIDQLSLVLKESNGPNSDSVRLFFNRIYERAEACSLCLAVALLHSNTDARIYEWATQAYFIYSGEPEIRKKSSLNYQQQQQQHHQLQGVDQNNLIMDNTENHSLYGDVTLIQNNRFSNIMNQKQMSYLNSPQQMSTPIMMRTKELFQQNSFNRPVFQNINNQNLPQSSATGQQQQQQQSECEIYFSGKHDALYIYLTRLLGPIWDLKLLKEFETTNTLFASFNDISIDYFLNKLVELRHFLDSNYPHLKSLQQHYLNKNTNLIEFATQYSSMSLNLQAMQTTKSEDKMAQELELGSIFLMRQFINRLVELFGLLKILDEHKYHFIAQKLDKQTQLIMLNMQIKTFLLSDDSLLEQLITALLYRYIDDNVCTDQLNLSLKQMCPSLYTNENAIFSKSCEKLKQALNIKNDNFERERLLKEAVDLIKQIGGLMLVSNLTQICEMLAQAGCHEAIFDLCLSACEKRDPQNIALHYYQKNEPCEDLEGKYYFDLRMECYKCMLDCLLMLMRQQKSYDKLIKLITSTKDELAHVSLFNLMIENGMEKKLVTLADSPFLQTYLLKEIQTQTGKNRIYLDLLWRHYDFKKDYINTAKVLTALAEKYTDSSQISLKERVEYLTQAIVALNSSTQVNVVKDEIAELNDKKDVALLQERIFDHLSRIEPRNEAVQEALILLDSQLFDITKLYYDFAEKFDLYQCQLAIFKMSRHVDQKTIELLWKRIIADELDKLSSSDEIKPSDLKTQLSENIVNIAKEYCCTGDEDETKYFPLITLIDSLEFVSLSRGFEPEWACNLLRKLNIPFNQLIQAYNCVYLKKDVKWAENSSRFINSIYSLIELFTRAPNATNENDKSLFLLSVRDLMPKYLTELNGINDELSRDLITKMKTLNYMLERM